MFWGRVGRDRFASKDFSERTIPLSFQCLSFQFLSLGIRVPIAVDLTIQQDPSVTEACLLDILCNNLNQTINSNWS